MNRTPIEWCDRASNPVRARRTSDGKVGWVCTKCASGCQNCFAERRNVWVGTGERFTQEALDSGRVEFWLDEKELRKVLKSRATGESVFVGDMTDLWHENVPYEWVDRIFGVCTLRYDLDFCFLTKRPDRLAKYFQHVAHSMRGWWHQEAGYLVQRLSGGTAEGWKDVDQSPAANKAWRAMRKHYYPCANPMVLGDTSCAAPWPLRNVYLGMSASNQPDFDAGIGHMRNLGVAGWKTFVSLEPLLGSVSAGGYLASEWWCPDCRYVGEGGSGGEVCDLCGEPFPEPGPSGEMIPCACGSTDYTPLCPRCGCELTCADWPDGEGLPGTLSCVIVGGETGPGARPMHPEWVRAIRDQSAAAGVPFFFKAWGEWGPGHDGKTRADMVRLGRKRTGRLLDGVIHDATPWPVKKRDKEVTP